MEYDREIKAPLYAESGIPVYWLVNLRDDQIECYIKPEGGVYQSVQQLDMEDDIQLPRLSRKAKVRDLMLAIP